LLVSTTLSTAKNLRRLVGLKRSVLSSFCVDIHLGLQAGVDVAQARQKFALASATYSI
jgi:hypothetical protein